jgi:hypothetical protein
MKPLGLFGPMKVSYPPACEKWLLNNPARRVAQFYAVETVGEKQWRIV